MNQQNPTRRILAWLLSAAMVLGTTPVTAMAQAVPAAAVQAQSEPIPETPPETPPVPAAQPQSQPVAATPPGAAVQPQGTAVTWEIVTFAELPEETASREVPLGTPWEKLDLPATLTATVRLATATDLDAPEDGTATHPVPVTWTAQPDYLPGGEGEEPGDYLFVPQPDEGYILTDGASAPQIAVRTLAPVMAQGLLGAGAPVVITGLEIFDIQHAIEDALADSDTVTVTGSRTGVGTTLWLTIPEGKTLQWGATFKSSNPFNGTLIYAQGGGTFEVVSGGDISATGDNGATVHLASAGAAVTVSGGTVSLTGSNAQAIYANGQNSTVTVSGGTVTAGGYATAIRTEAASSHIAITGGRVEAADGSAINAAGSVTVEDGVVSGGVAISTPQTNTDAVVTVSGGTVSAAGFTAISVQGENARITVSSGTVSSDTRSAILTNGNNATVSVTGGTVTGGGAAGTTYPVINMTGTPADAAAVNVTVSGTGKVEATGDTGMAIHTWGSVVVRDSAAVSATTGYAIYSEYGDDAKSVTVEGGTVSATTGYAILVNGKNDTVTVKGGAVSSSSNGIAIYTPGENTAVTVSGTGKVEATGSNSFAIYTYGKVEVKDSATVSSAVGRAIYATGAASQVTVSGGQVTGGGNASNPVIQLDNLENTGLNVIVSDTGKVEATGVQGTAIQAFSSVTVSGGSVRSVGSNSVAIHTGYAFSTVTVSDGTVEATGTSGIAIRCYGKVTVSGGTVTGQGAGDNFPVIHMHADGYFSFNVTVSGTGKVEATGTGTAIRTIGNISQVAVSGGTVTGGGSGGNPVIHMYNEANTGLNVTVSGTGKVEATGDTGTSGTAIYTYGSVEVKGGTVSSVTGKAIHATGAASTVTVSGGTVTGGGSYTSYPVIAIAHTSNNGLNVIVSGTGQVLATGDNGYAIRTFGSVAVMGNTTVSATTGYAICVESSDVPRSVTIEAGTVKATTGYAIRVNGKNDTVEVKGGAVSSTTGSAIYAGGAAATVTVSGGTVTGGSNDSSSAVISMMSYQNTGLNVTVSGTGKVEATGTGGTAIRTWGSVAVTGNTTVSATTGCAICVEGGTDVPRSVTIEDGTVKATTGYAIRVNGKNDTVTVKGGTVSSTTGSAIYAGGAAATVTVSGGTVTGGSNDSSFAVISMTGSQNTGLNVTVSGAGQVLATGDSGRAIHTQGSVAVRDMAQVSATSGIAIYAIGITSQVTVSGGLVFAHRGAFTGADGVIYLQSNPDGFTGATGAGVVLGWDGAAPPPAYTLRSSQDLVLSPGAAAHWGRSGGQPGIFYQNGANQGFLPISGVALDKIILTSSDDFRYAFPDPFNVYNGTPQGVGTATVKDPCFDAATGGTVTVTYNGSTTVPTDAGSYVMRAEVSGGTEYAASSVGLGIYPIMPRPVTVRVDDKSMTAGGVLPVLTYTVEGQLEGETALTDTLVLSTQTDGKTVGSFDIVADLTGLPGMWNPNYAPADPFLVTGTLTVTSPPISRRDREEAPPAVSPNLDASGAVSQSAITAEAGEALAAPGGTAVVRTQGAQSISPDALRALARLGTQAGKQVVLYADTMSGGAVQGRLYVRPALLTAATADLRLGVYTQPGKTGAASGLFQHYFNNHIVVVHLEQQGPLGARLEVAAKVDLSQLNPKTLYFYAYHQASNTYTRIWNPGYWVDKNGYLHFYTAQGGDIIITDSPLARRN